MYSLLLYLLPKNLLSRIFGFISNQKLSKKIVQKIIKKYIKFYDVCTEEIEIPLERYSTFNSFFTRKLKKNIRIIDQDSNKIISPVDGTILNFGDIQNLNMIQTKGISFSIDDLIPSKFFQNNFQNGKWITIYLSPKDYHRIHFPFSGEVIGYNYNRGRLFPVNHIGVHHIKNLFSKNERLTTYLKTPHGLMAIVKVGATCVGKIRVTYDSISSREVFTTSKEVLYEQSIKKNKGDELGIFEIGSTVILCFEATFNLNFLKLTNFQKIQLGTPIAFVV